MAPPQKRKIAPGCSLNGVKKVKNFSSLNGVKKVKKLEILFLE
jgi:hypothetical protein